MKKLTSLLLVLLFSLVLITPAAAQTAPTPTITFVNLPADNVLVLSVGQTYTFEVQVESDQPFIHAQLGLTQYFPGRSIFSEGIQMSHQGNQATLHLTVTGKAPTAKFPDGQVLVTLITGVRYQGGYVVSDARPFYIVVQ